MRRRPALSPSALIANAAAAVAIAFPPPDRHTHGFAIMSSALLLARRTRPPCPPFRLSLLLRSAPRPSPSLSSLAPMYLLRPLPPPPTCHAAQVERGSHCSLAHSVLAQQQVTCEERRAWGGRRAGRDDRTQRTVGRSAARPSSLTDDGRTAEERSVVGEASRGRTDAEGRPLPTAALPGAVAERDGLTD